MINTSEQIIEINLIFDGRFWYTFSFSLKLKSGEQPDYQKNSTRNEFQIEIMFGNSKKNTEFIIGMGNIKRILQQI